MFFFLNCFSSQELKRNQFNNFLLLGENEKSKNLSAAELKLEKLNAFLEQLSEEEPEDDGINEIKPTDFPISSLNQLMKMEDMICTNINSERQLVGFLID